MTCTIRLSKSRIYVEMFHSLFSRSMKIGRRPVGWREHEIREIIAAQMEGQSEDEICELVKRLEKQRKFDKENRMQ